MEHNLPGRAGWVRLAECFREIQHERAGFPLCFSRLEVRNDLFHGLRVSKVEQMETELRKLSQAELRQIRAWLDDLIEDELEFTPEFERSIQEAERDLADGQSARVREPEGS